MDAVQPRFQVCEDEMDDWQIFLGDLRIAPFSDDQNHTLSGVCERAMTVPTVNAVSRRHLRQRKTPGRFAKRNGSPAA